jgi:hypothetical protein
MESSHFTHSNFDNNHHICFNNGYQLDLKQLFWITDILIYKSYFRLIDSILIIIVILLLAKLDSAIADVSTNRNVSTAGIY